MFIWKDGFEGNCKDEFGCIRVNLSWWFFMFLKGFQGESEWNLEWNLWEFVSDLIDMIDKKISLMD